MFGNVTGISVRDAIATGNKVFGNSNGILVGPGGSSTYGGSASGNQVYANSTGITVYVQGDAIGNYVYSNLVGIRTSVDRYQFQGTLKNNLVYANTERGLAIDSATAGAAIISNTVVQTVGDALRIANGSNGMLIRNNILMVESGNAVNVANDQASFDMDWNLLHQGEDPNAHIGMWGTTVLDSLIEWQTATLMDTNSLTGDPGFLDIDGADNILGYVSDNGGYDGGQDDNFYRTIRSIAIDRGDTWTAPLVDIAGTARVDDVGTLNAGAPDYFETSLPPEPFQSVGVAFNYNTDNSYVTVNLPFPFDFYGNSYTSLRVSTDGFLHFSGPDPAYGDNTINAFIRNARIAPLWDNLTTAPAGKDIYVDDSVPDQVTFRWAAANVADGSDLNFSVTLFLNGNIQFDYGAGNQNLSPTVGISAGDGMFWMLTSYDGRDSLDSLNPISIELAAGYADLGAYEFAGNSNDVSPPIIVGSIPTGVHAEATFADAIDRITLQLSEPINPIDAGATAAYSLLYSGPDGTFGNLDDKLVEVTPSYEPGSTSITLNASELLESGTYRLTLLGDTTLHDLSGLRLDGDFDGTEGGNYVREFTVIQDAPPTANDQSVTTDEDVEFAITLTGDDGNPTIDQPLRYMITGLPVDGTLAQTAGGAAMTDDLLPLLLTSPVVYFTPSPNSHASSTFLFVTRDDAGIGIAPDRTSDPATVTIDVTPVNDQPTLNDASAATSEFAAQNAIVTTIGFTDPDLLDTASDTHTLAITGGNDDGAFSIDATGKIYVVNSALLDYESAPSRELVVTVTDAAGLSDSSTVSVTIQDAQEAQVESVVINDGESQRIVIDSLTVNFNRLVDFDLINGAAFVLQHVESGDVVETLTQAMDQNGKTVVVLQFVTGSHVDAMGRLGDGNYQLTILASRVSAEGFALDGDKDGIVGDDFFYGADAADSFFRLFGDSDGDRDVDGQDFGRFGLSFLSKTGDANYDPAMDFDADGDVDSQDYGRFRRNFLRRISS